jgi:hypothetical protein
MLANEVTTRILLPILGFQYSSSESFILRSSGSSQLMTGELRDTQELIPDIHRCISDTGEFNANIFIYH